MYKNDLILRAAKGMPVERTPVWVMRQAGRILKEYRKVRKDAGSFKNLVETPSLAAEVTVQPVDILDVDAAIIFSDILVVPEAMGLPYEMVEKKGPFFNKVITAEKDLSEIRMIGGGELEYVYEAIKVAKASLSGRVPLIGFAGAPWTIFCYMTEGEGSKTFSKSRKLLYRDPVLSKKLLHLITESTIIYLKEQIKAGADMVQLFDSWAGILSQEQYQEFAMPGIRRICDSIQEVPVTIFSKGAYTSLESIAALPCHTIGMDWQMNIDHTRKIVGSNKTLQGNLDPCVLYGTRDNIKKETRKMLDKFKGTRHIANLGHGVYPDTDPDHVRCFIDTVKEYSSR
ncbi:MAG: uroporphyrinogen decarboxylase [Cyclobacteriaceae bacterium]|nr:uroporphyrinogen decarboxylase [Cyclobacteriaceae bacterium]